MSETYSTIRDRLIARYKSQGLPEPQAILRAQKRASAIANKAHPGDKVSNQGRHKIKEMAHDIVMEIHGITGLIGGGGAGPGGGPVGGGGSDPGSPDPSTTSTPLSDKYRKQDADDPSKASGKGKSSAGFKTSGGRKSDAARKTSKATKSKGSMTASPPSMEAIEAEFGII